MPDFPRWERESIEDLHAPAPQPDATVEFDASAAFDAEADVEEEYDAYGDDEEYDDDEPGGERVPMRESLTATRESIAGAGRRVGRWLHSLDRRPELDAHLRAEPDLVAELGAGPMADTALEPAPAPASVRSESEAPQPVEESPGRFPVAPLGYNRHAVDEHVAGLEAELERLRARLPEPPVSITEEIERIGEQTASILVVAHDQAHETARLAREQADRAVGDATAEAERITGDAARRLRELDEETDAVWRERERLLADVRTVSLTLGRLADEAERRFPADERADAGAIAG